MTTDTSMTRGDGLGGAEPLAMPRAAAVPGSTIMLKRTADAGKVPDPLLMADGEVFLNINTSSAALYVKGSGGEVRSLGGVQVAASSPLYPVEGLLWWDTTNEVLKLYNAGAFVDLSEPINLGYTAAADGGTVTNTGGTDAVIPVVGADAGLMTPADKTKLDTYPGSYVAPNLQAVTDQGSTTTTGATFGNGAIALQAEGSATFKGQVDSDRADGGDVAFTAKEAGSTTLAIRADGTTLIGGTSPGAGVSNIRLDPDGSGTFKAPDGSGKTLELSSDATQALYVYNGGNQARINWDGSAKFGGSNTSLNADGSAEFSGTVESNGPNRSFVAQRPDYEDGVTPSGNSFAVLDALDSGNKTTLRLAANGSIFGGSPGGSVTASVNNYAINSDGSASFAGQVLSSRAAGTNNAFMARVDGDTTNQMLIRADGSIETLSYVAIGGTPSNPATANIALNASGYSLFKRDFGSSVYTYTVLNSKTGATAFTIGGGNAESGSAADVNWYIQGDGSGSFATNSVILGPDGGGYLIVGGNPANGVNEGVSLSGTGQFTAAANSDSDSIWQGYKVGSGAGNFSSLIRADGSASFASEVLCTSATTNAFLASADLASGLTMFRAAHAGVGDANRFFFYGTDSSGGKAYIATDGSASFAADVTIGTYNPAGVDKTGVINSFAGYVGVQRTETQGNATVFTAIQGDTETINFRANGSAAFAPGTDKSLKTEIIPIGTGGGIISGIFESQGDLAGTTTAFSVRPTTAASEPSVAINHDGSATFAGNVDAGGIPSSGAAAGVRLWSVGQIDAARDSGGSSVFKGYIVGNSTPTTRIDADGSANFQGSISAGTVSSNTAYSFINTDGSIELRRSNGNEAFAIVLTGSNDRYIP